MKERSDEELLDSLYGERADRLDGEVAREAASTDDDDLEMAQLRRMRGMFAELKASQEEPPPAGMALLMAAARQAAEERKPKQEGLWARLRAGWHAMVAHPAMAAAAAAVVVIGASGYLMSRGVKTAESTYSAGETTSARAYVDEKSDEAAGAPTAAPASVNATAPVVADPAAVAPAMRQEMATGTATGAATGSGAMDLDDGVRDRRQAPAKKMKVAPRPADEAGLSSPVEGGSAGVIGGVKDGARLDENYAKQNPGAVSGSGSSAGKPRPNTASPPPPPPPPPPAQAPAPDPSPESESESVSAGDEEDSAAASRDEAKKQKGVESITQQSERWYQLARDAAAKGDCNAVKLLGQRVAAENPGFYEKRFKKDASLAKCL